MRSSTLRRVGCSRSISRKPVSLPMLHLLGRHQRRHRCWRAIETFGARASQHALVFMREDLDEARLRIGPMLQDPGGARAAGQVAMPLKQTTHTIDIFAAGQRFQIYAGPVATPRGEVALVVVDIRDASAHACCEVAPGRSKHNHHSVGYVLAAVVPD